MEHSMGKFAITHSAGRASELLAAWQTLINHQGDRMKSYLVRVRCDQYIFQSLFFTSTYAYLFGWAVRRRLVGNAITPGDGNAESDLSVAYDSFGASMRNQASSPATLNSMPSGRPKNMMRWF
jgi:hypothetical protein